MKRGTVDLHTTLSHHVLNRTPSVGYDIHQSAAHRMTSRSKVAPFERNLHHLSHSNYGQIIYRTAVS
jgi:hypothetical protein